MQFPSQTLQLSSRRHTISNRSSRIATADQFKPGRTLSENQIFDTLVTNTQFCEPLKPFESEVDSEIDFLNQKLQKVAEWKKCLSKDLFKTKDPIIDISTTILGKYGIKVQLVYKDIQTNGVTIRGVKDLDMLRDFLCSFISLLKIFPAQFINKIKWKSLMICNQVQCTQHFSYNEGIFSLKRHYDGNVEKIQNHLSNVIFKHVMQVLPCFAKIQQQCSSSSTTSPKSTSTNKVSSPLPNGKTFLEDDYSSKIKEIYKAFNNQAFGVSESSEAGTPLARSDPYEKQYIEILKSQLIKLQAK